MSRIAFYRELLPGVIRRLFTLGLLFAGLFIVFWYLLGGYTLWGNLIAFLARLDFDPADGVRNAGLIYHFATQGVSGDIVYKINSLSPNLVVLALLIGSWPFAKLADMLKVASWCLLFILIFQVVTVWLNMYYTSISPGFADQLHLFWEKSTWFTIMNRINGFDKFILRYYGAFPVFAAAMITASLVGNRKAPKKASK